MIVCGACQRTDAQGVQQTLLPACAETINIGVRGDNVTCMNDEACNPAGWASTPPERRSLCEPTSHRCMVPLSLSASYAAAVNNYIAGGGSGFSRSSATRRRSTRASSSATP